MQFKEKKDKDGKTEFVFSEVIETKEKSLKQEDIDFLRRRYEERKKRAEAQLKEANEMLAELDKADEAVAASLADKKKKAEAEGKLQDKPSE